MIGGVDEAGRGPVIGPLVICGVLLEEEDIEMLRKLGVRDSKMLTPEKRERLAETIREVCRGYRIVKVPPSEIDAAKSKHALNELESKKFAEIIDELEPEEVYVDSVDPDPRKFRERLLRYLHHIPEKMIVENFADKKYIPVGAASILAKVARDSEVKKLSEKFGDFGSGYPSDPRTIQFLRRWKERYGEFPEFVRKSWKTLERL